MQLGNVSLARPVMGYTRKPVLKNGLASEIGRAVVEMAFALRTYGQGRIAD